MSTVVQHRHGGLFGRIVDDRYNVCGQYETPVEFWQVLMDGSVKVTGYICVPTCELIPIDGGATLMPERDRTWKTR